jgi:hypothetical protein
VHISLHQLPAYLPLHRGGPLSVINKAPILLYLNTCLISATILFLEKYIDYIYIYEQNTGHPLISHILQAAYLPDIKNNLYFSFSENRIWETTIYHLGKRTQKGDLEI